jgi:hypothetical protein
VIRVLLVGVISSACSGDYGGSGFLGLLHQRVHERNLMLNRELPEELRNSLGIFSHQFETQCRELAGNLFGCFHGGLSSIEH